MNPHLHAAIEQYETKGYDFQKILSWHLVHGMVFCTPDLFALGYHADSKLDFQPVEYPHSDTLFVVWCSGDMRAALHPFVDRYERIAWQRSFKNSPRVRCYRMADVHTQLTRQDNGRITRST